MLHQVVLPEAAQELQVRRTSRGMKEVVETYTNVHKSGSAVVLHQLLIMGALQQVWIRPGLQFRHSRVSLHGGKADSLRLCPQDKADEETYQHGILLVSSLAATVHATLHVRAQSQ